MVRYGITGLWSFRTTDGQARRYFFEDLRKAENLSFLEMRMALKLSRRIPPHDQKTAEKNIRYTGMDIPQDLTHFTPNISAISASIRPGREMVICVNKQRAIDAPGDPPFAPYLIPKLAENPWAPHPQQLNMKQPGPDG